MATYSAEPIPTKILTDLLIDQWDAKTGSGSIPRPTIIDVNSSVETQRAAREANLERGDYILAFLDIPGEEEIPIGNWTYVNRKSRVAFEVYSAHSRQRLYDIKQEVRRIIHSNIHSVTSFQRVEYKGFTESIDQQYNVWVGRISVELVNNALTKET